MGMLRSLFGPSKREIWQKVCDELGGTYVKGGFFSSSMVEVSHGEWTITLDTYTDSDGESSTTYTRIRAPYVNKDGFRFTVYRKSIFSDLGKVLGMQDIEVGYPEFDRDFIIKGNDEAKVRQFCRNPLIRQRIAAQPRIRLKVKDDEGWFRRRFPEGVDELCFEAVGVIKDADRLLSLFELFAESLDHLCHIGSAYENNPNMYLD